MESISTPQVINMPFCADGDKNTIPSAATGTQRASLEEGFPEITSKPISEGGIPPEREDFNGAMNLNSQFYFAFQNGWWPTFDAEVSTAIGGYPLGAVLWWFPTTGEYANMAVPLKSLVANNTYNFNTNTSYIGVYWQPLYKQPNALPIGTVFGHQSKNASDVPGALPLFTGETISSANTMYPDFYNWVLSHTELQISAADYESAITTYGECPKYVIDDTNKTIRLPKLTNYIKMANTTDGITQAADSIPLVEHIHVFGNNTGNNSGNFVASNQSVTAPNPDITEGSGYRVWNGSGGGGSYGGDTDTSTGNMITSIGIEAPAKNATEQGSLQPAHTTLYPWVCAYNAAVPASTAQAAEFQQALSSKVDVADMEEVQCVVETYNNGTSWYRVWSDGWCEQGGRAEYSSSNTVSVSFLKQFKDTNFFVNCSSILGASLTSSGYSFQNSQCANLSVSGFTTYVTNNYPKTWYACGYIN